MKKRIIIGAFAVLAAIGLVFAFSACEGVLTWSVTLTNFAATGTIVDAQSGGGIAGVEVTLTLVPDSVPEAETEEVVVEEGDEAETTKETEEDKTYEEYDDNTIYTAVTDADGVFTFNAEVENIIVGEYTVEFTGGTTGFAFVPPENVTILGDSDQNLGTYIGFPYSANQATDLKFILMWSESFSDVDLHLTYPTSDDINGGTADFTHPYDGPYTTNGVTGSIPQVGVTTGRNDIFWGDATTVGGTADNKPTTFDYTYGTGADDTWRIELDVDDTNGRGPETITVRTLPVWYDETGPNGALADNISGGGDTGITTQTGITYTWHGAMQVYADAWSAAGNSTRDDADELSGADAVLYIFQGETVLGIYRLPEFTSVDTASLVRINLFTKIDSADTSTLIDFYQIVPNMMVFQDNNEIRGISPSILNVEGARRSRY